MDSARDGRSTLEAALFSLKVGETNGVCRNPFRILHLQGGGGEEEKERSLEDVRKEILKSLKKEKGKAEASRKAEDAFYSLFRSRDIETYAQEKNVTIKTTGFFKEGDDVPKIGRDPNFYASAFSLKVGDISSVLNVGPNFLS